MANQRDKVYTKRGVTYRVLSTGIHQVISTSAPYENDFVGEFSESFYRSGKKNKITVSTLVWGRPKIFEMFCKNMRSLVPSPHIVVAGSPNDECEDLAKEYGCEYIQTQNKELSRKANDSVELARGNCDYVLLMGSDDLMSQKMYDYYLRYDGCHLGLLDYYFYNILSGEMIYWGGYDDHRKGCPIGAGKLIRKDVLEHFNYRPFNDRILRPSENGAHTRFLQAGVPMDLKHIADVGGVSVDIKSEKNNTTFRLWPNSQFVDPKKILSPHRKLYTLIKQAGNEHT